MKKWLFFLAALAAIAALGGRSSSGTDVADLQPVQTVHITRQDTRITVKTDTGAEGTGKDLTAALENMNETTPALVFLDTADYLILAPELLYLLPELKEELRPSCRICLAEGQPNMEQVGAYLQIHEPKITLKDYFAGETDLPTLRTTQEGMQLVW